METIISGEVYKERIFDAADLRSTDLSECEFTHCSFIGANCIDSTWNAARFIDCNLQNAKIAGVNLFDTTFIGCKLSTIDFSNKTKILATQFQKCLVDFATFTGVDLSSLVFDQCSCIETNFSKAKLHNTVFLSCRIQNCLFTGAQFDKTDLHTCELSGIDIYNEKLRGIIVSAQQFLSLAPQVGVTIV